MQFHFLLHIWVWDDCRSISQQIYKRTISNLIRKNRMWWICWGPVELASKNLAKYLFDEKNGKTYLEDICFMDWQKCYCELFFSARPTCTTHQISYLSDFTLTFFCKKLRKYMTKYMKTNIYTKIWTILHHLEEK